MVNTTPETGASRVNVLLLAIQAGNESSAQARAGLEKPRNFQACHAGDVAGEILHLVGKFFIDAA